MNFNHATAGMTDPSLHISVDNQVVRLISTSTSSSSSSSTSNNTSKKKKTTWWPESSSSNTARETGGWRVLEYKARVGHGRNCYEAVRDKLLAWEFEADNNKRGIVAIIMEEQQQQSSSSSTPIRQESSHYGYDVVHTGPPNHDNPAHWRSTDSALCVGGEKQRLATFTKCGIFFWCVNPVKVVYDVIDQRAGPSNNDSTNASCLYSSSAYATTAGHWLVGEERLTVALRDCDGQVHVQLLSYSKPNRLWTKMAWPMVHKMQQQFFNSQMQYLQEVASQQEERTQQQQQQQLPALISKPVPMPLQEPVLMSLPLH